MNDELKTRAHNPGGPDPSASGEGTDTGTRPDPSNGPEGTVVQPTNASARAAIEFEARSRGGVVVPGYEVLDELGRGAMGVVFRARHVKLNRLVALKMALGGRVDEKDLIRFLAEAEAVASVKHDNVVQVYDYGESGGRPFMALEFCPAGSLADRLSQGGPLPPSDAAETVGRIAAGVAAAHEQGIVHRDLKPANILLAAGSAQRTANSEDEDKKVDPSLSSHGPLSALIPKVSDFGLAKRGTSELTATQAVMGTPSYMSPEQAGGKTKFVGPQADVWALGVILYECLTGARPFPGKTTDEVLAQVLHAEPAAVRTISATVPRDLELICRTCLEKNPADRYPTAQELSDDLGRFVRGEPISVRPLGSAALAVRWARRNPVVAGLMSAVVLITLGLIGSLYGQYRQAVSQAGAEREAKEGAERERQSAEQAKLSAEQATQSADLARQSAERAAEQTKLREEAERRRGQAELAATRSAAEAEQANALIDLLNDLFRSSDPLALFFGDAVPALGGGGTPEGQAAVLGPFLRNAAARFRGSLTDPATALVRAKLLAGIGNGMKSLGMFTEAKPILEEALALRLKHLPETNPDVWRSELDLGRLEAEGGDLVISIERFRRVLALQKKAGADPETILTTRFYEGVALSTAGMPEAGEVLKDVAAGRQKLLGKNHKDTILAKLGVIAWLLERGKFAEIITLFGEFREDMRALPDRRIREIFEPVLDAQAKLAMAAAASQPGSLLSGRLRPAVEGLKVDVARLEKLIPEDHLILCIYRYELAVLLLELGDEREADALYARVLADAKKTVGLAHPKVLLLLESYSRRLAATGRVPEARALFDQVEKANRERFGPDNPWLTLVTLKRARFEYRQGDSVKALAAVKVAVALVQREKFLPTVGGLAELFETAKLVGRSNSTGLRAAARDLFTALRPMVVKVYGPRSEEMVYLLSAEAQQLYRAGDRRAAAACLDAALPMLPDVPKLEPLDRVIVLHWCGRIALDRGQLADAEKHFRAATEAAKRVPDYSAADKLEDVEYLARAVAARERFADAVPLFEEARRLTSPKAIARTLLWSDYQVATAQLAAGDRTAHAKTLAKMTAQHAKATDPDTLSRLAWAGGLGAKPDGWDAVAFEARYAAGLKPETVYPWGWRGLALVRVRAGKLDAVEAALAKAGPLVYPADHLIRGLAAVARNDVPAARVALAKAEALIEAQKPTDKTPFAYAGRLWHMQVDDAILLAELRAAVAPPLAPPPRPKG